MTPPLEVGHVDHRATIYSLGRLGTSGTGRWAWRCTCGDDQAGYLKRQYAASDARMHEQRPETPRVPR